jgi:hypothetical protein
MALFHTRSHGSDKAAVGRAVDQAIALAVQSGQKICRIAAHTKVSFQNGVFARLYGDDFVKAVAGIGGGALGECRFYLMTERIFPSAPRDSPIIATHISPAWLESLIAAHGDASVIYMPWMYLEFRKYQKAHPDSREV